MPARSDQATNAGRRRERRRQQRNRHIRVQVPRVKKRSLRDQTATNVADCFHVCNDRGFHFDPDVKIGSSLDPLYNPFSVLKVEQPSQYMQRESPRRPARSTFAFGALPTKSKPSSPSSLPPPISNTSLTQPTVRLPGTHSAQQSTLPDLIQESSSPKKTSTSTEESFFHELALTADLFLYQNQSREALPGIDDGDLDIARCFALACGQEKPGPDFKSYKTDKTVNTVTVDAHADVAAQSVVYDAQTFIGAALPDMSKAVPTEPLSRMLDAQFYKRTRSYLPYCGVDPQWSFAKLCDRAFRSGDEEVKELASTDPNSNNSLAKRHPKLSRSYTRSFTEKAITPPSPPTEPRPITAWTSEQRPTTAWIGKRGSFSMGNDLEAGEIITKPPAKQESMRYELVFPKLAPSAACDKSIITKEGSLCDRRLERLIRLWANSDVESRTPANSAPALDPDNTAKAMVDFERVMSPKDNSGAASLGLLQPSTGTHDLSTRTSSTESISRDLRRRSRGRIYLAAIAAANTSPDETKSAETVDIAACPTPACSALVPARLYQHQYLCWPAHFQYRESTWKSQGAGTTRKKSEQDFDDQNKRAAGVKKLVDGIAQDLGLDQKHDQSCCYANETDHSWSTEPAVCPEGSKTDKATGWPTAPWNGPDAEIDGAYFGLDLLFGKDKTYEGVDAPAGESLGCSPRAALQTCEDAVENVESPGEEGGYTSAESGWTDVKDEEEDEESSGWDLDEAWTDDETFF